MLATSIILGFVPLYQPQSSNVTPVQVTGQATDMDLRAAVGKQTNTRRQ
jgi:hypothetical protein